MRMTDTPPKPTASRGAILTPPEGVAEAHVWLAEAIEWARAHRATDLHLFPSEAEAMLWVRVDGELREVARYPLAVHTRMISRLKVLGRCADYAGELIQEGRFTLNGRASEGEARLSIVPTLHGDKAVIRLLAGGEQLRPLTELGFPERLIDVLRDAMDRPQGLVLAVGPSGCGKSTALYALLQDLNTRAGRPVSILTIEDPVEQSLSFAAQISAEPAHGVGFAEGLRALLRQDPEVIMIGEIRDPETANAALQAALTGHRLISSMHTLSAGEALVRLAQMGAAPYVIASALAGVLNLRLVRLLCPHCKRTRPMTEEERVRFPESEDWPTVAEAPGCETCLESGHLERTGLGEWLVPTPATAEALGTRQPSATIARTLQSIAPARPAALELMREGRIGLDEWPRLAGLTSLQLAEGV